ncbi:MAG: NTP transferase domain-containing protein [Chloroflexi bacterium]|nr:NTP transferase domain-containing protein [Chloroflexota bacterium]
MKVVILAAGEGKRMHPLTYTRPKVMLPVANKPILAHLIDSCRQAGLSDFVVVAGYRAAVIQDYFSDKALPAGATIEYVSQEKQSGTGNAVYQVRDRVKGPFLVLNGDILLHPNDIGAVTSRNEMQMGLYELETVKHLGVVELKDNRVRQIHEKVDNPPSHLVNAGVYLLNEAIFDALEKIPQSPRGEYELTAALQLLIDNGHAISGHRLAYWEDISYPWQLLEINERLLKGMKEERAGVIEDGVHIKGDLSVGEGTVVKSGAYIEGPVMIGRDSRIGPNCYIRGSTAVGNDCHIGAAVEVKSSIIMDHTDVPHLNYVGDSVIGQGCNLGAGTKIANLRLDKGNISVRGIDTGRRKLGAIIGDNVQTGINCSINLGCMIGNDCAIGPGTLASGVIPPNSALLPHKTRPGKG